MPVHSEKLSESPFIFFLEFLLSASDSISLQSLSKGLNRPEKNGTKLGSAWEPLLTYKTGRNVVREVNSENQLTGQSINMVLQKLKRIKSTEPQHDKGADVYTSLCLF